MLGFQCSPWIRQLGSSNFLPSKVSLAVPSQSIDCCVFCRYVDKEAVYNLAFTPKERALLLTEHANYSALTPLQGKCVPEILGLVNRTAETLCLVMTYIPVRLCLSATRLHNDAAISYLVGVGRCVCNPDSCSVMPWTCVMSNYNGQKFMLLTPLRPPL